MQRRLLQPPMTRTIVDCLMSELPCEMAVELNSSDTASSTTTATADKVKPPVNKSSARTVSRKLLYANDPLCALPQPDLYYFERGFRKVRPYAFKYKTYVKKRMLYRPLLDVVRHEFASRPLAYYVRVCVCDDC